MKTGTVIAVRHGDKVGDKGADALTVGGAQDIFITAGWLKDRRIKHIEYSGANRTRQCANIAQASLSLWDVPIIENRGWHFEKPFAEAFHGNDQAYKAELETIKEAGGLVEHALKISEYAKKASAQLIETILNSLERNNNEPVLTYSHSPYVSLAYASLPYDIPTSSVIIYHVNIDKNRISSAEYMPYKAL